MALLSDTVRYKGMSSYPMPHQNPKRKANCNANNISAFSLMGLRNLTLQKSLAKTQVLKIYLL